MDQELSPVACLVVNEEAERDEHLALLVAYYWRDNLRTVTDQRLQYCLILVINLEDPQNQRLLLHQ